MPAPQPRLPGGVGEGLLGGMIVPGGHLGTVTRRWGRSQASWRSVWGGREYTHERAVVFSSEVCMQGMCALSKDVGAGVPCAQNSLKIPAQCPESS